jgi:hypothetical protein
MRSFKDGKSLFGKNGRHRDFILGFSISFSDKTRPNVVKNRPNVYYISPVDESAINLLQN